MLLLPVIQYNIWKPDLIGWYIQSFHPTIVLWWPHQFIVIPLLQSKYFLFLRIQKHHKKIGCCYVLTMSINWMELINVTDLFSHTKMANVYGYPVYTWRWRPYTYHQEYKKSSTSTAINYLAKGHISHKC